MREACPSWITVACAVAGLILRGPLTLHADGYSIVYIEDFWAGPGDHYFYSGHPDEASGNPTPIQTLGPHSFGTWMTDARVDDLHDLPQGNNYPHMENMPHRFSDRSPEFGSLWDTDASSPRGFVDLGGWGAGHLVYTETFTINDGEISLSPGSRFSADSEQIVINEGARWGENFPRFCWAVRDTNDQWYVSEFVDATDYHGGTNWSDWWNYFVMWQQNEDGYNPPSHWWTGGAQFDDDPTKLTWYEYELGWYPRYTDSTRIYRWYTENEFPGDIAVPDWEHITGVGFITTEGEHGGNWAYDGWLDQFHITVYVPAPAPTSGSALFSR